MDFRRHHLKVRSAGAQIALNTSKFNLCCDSDQIFHEKVDANGTCISPHRRRLVLALTFVHDESHGGARAVRTLPLRPAPSRPFRKADLEGNGNG